MSDAPERIWRSSGRMWYFEPPENLQTVEYIRADIHEKAVEALRKIARGRKKEDNRAHGGDRYGWRYGSDGPLSAETAANIARRTLKELEADDE